MNYRYLCVFLFFSIVGYLFETKLLNKPQETFFGETVPLLPIYGFGGIILLYIASFNVSIFYKTILATILLTIMECIGGLISYQINKEQTWRYTEGYPFCFGYNSIFTSIVWMVSSLSFFITYDFVS